MSLKVAIFTQKTGNERILQFLRLMPFQVEKSVLPSLSEQISQQMEVGTIYKARSNTWLRDENRGF